MNRNTCYTIRILVYYQLFLDGSNWGVSIHRASKGLVTKYGDGVGGYKMGGGGASEVLPLQKKREKKGEGGGGGGVAILKGGGGAQQVLR